MRLSQNAKIYQLEHGHKITAAVTHGEQTQKIKCGLIGDTQNKTTYVHGVEGGQNLTELETVNFVRLQVGDKIELENGVKGKVHELHQTLLDKNNIQLRFVPFEKAEKITRIIIKYV